MVTFETATLWKCTLAARSEPDQFRHERERLRSAFLSFRDRAAMLAAEIARDLPDYTVHDITHLDALWQLADLIAGSEYELTPTEAFVLGGAFLTHDLGNGLAAYPDGVAAMYTSTGWRDAVSLVLRRQIGRAATTEEIQGASQTVRNQATAQVLRTMHAQQAERLALVSWKDPDSGAQRFLLEEVFLRETYGRLIGRIAHSHWWSLERLKPEFEFVIGAPANYPQSWTVDPLKLACLLRVADAAHLDSTRAPAFLKTVRRPLEESRKFWCFQERLQQPILNGDRLVYTSSQRFSHSESNSWWLCFEALQMLDRELAGVDSILADCNRCRFAVRGVQGAENALRLSRWIQTEGWSPVDTRIKVTDVAELASRLGGSQLYGTDNLVPLRELIQNATDAIRARRYLENRVSNYGDITVRIGEDREGHWIQVSDNGIGMSERVMTGPLLDFGVSFWNSRSMSIELPGLAASGFESTGRYGIGFFSLFMWGSHVRVISRSYRDAPRETRVLEFQKGLQARPTIREAFPDEYLAEGGTAVRVWVGQSSDSIEGVLVRPMRRRNKIEEICEWLCPAIDANLYVQRGDQPRTLIIGASDWKTMDGVKLLKRLTDDHEVAHWMLAEEERLAPLTAANLVPVEDPSGNITGRIAIIPQPGWGAISFGAVTAGGLRTCGIRRIAGILEGITTTASRTSAVPIIEPSKLAAWASTQAQLVRQLTSEKAVLAGAGETISHCGGSPADLPVAEGAKGWLQVSEIASWGSSLNEVVLLDTDEVTNVFDDFGELSLMPGVLACPTNPGRFLESGPYDLIAWPQPKGCFEGPYRSRSIHALILRTLAECWSATVEEVIAISDITDYPEPTYLAQVGMIGGKPIRRQVDILRNPHAVPPATRVVEAH